MNFLVSRMCAIGATPPMLNPVSLRTAFGSAREIGSPATFSASSVDTRLPPAVRNMMMPPDRCPVNTMDLTI